MTGLLRIARSNHKLRSETQQLILGDKAGAVPFGTNPETSLGLGFPVDPMPV